MTRLCRAGEVMGLPVVTLDTASAVGEVRDILFDPTRAKVIGFTLRGRGLLSPPLTGLLPIDVVRSIGQGALMIASESGLVGEREGMTDALQKQIEVIGKEVVNDAGEALGEVIDVILEIDGPTASVVGYEVGSGDWRVIVPLPEGIPVSDKALVVPAAAEPYIAQGLSGFRETLERARRSREEPVLREPEPAAAGQPAVTERDAEQDGESLRRGEEIHA
ncbi:MAG: PRC-barrel domain-containing protein [Chloroflexota bacterium]|nr:PRC-barrel domain-containing protein [Chloroflexota bacterium]